MSWGVYATASPPLLLSGDVVQFQSREGLAMLIEPELSHQRIMCINVAGLGVNQRRKLRMQVQGVTGEVLVHAESLHLQGDLVGLQVTCDALVLTALKAMAGPKALALAARAHAISESPPAVAPVPARAEATMTPAPADGSVEALWVDATQVMEPWDLGGLLLQQTEPPSGHGHSGRLGAGDGTPVPDGPTGPTEHTTVRGGPGLGAFVEGGGGRKTLFRTLAERVKEAQGGHLVLSVGGGGAPMELHMDARGGVTAFGPGMALARPDQDAQTLRAERRRQLAERLTGLGALPYLDVAATPGHWTAAPGEKTVPLLEALMQWVELALLHEGSEPIAAHYHRHLFEYPVLSAPASPTGAKPDWSPDRLPLDRLQQRFVHEAMISGRTLQDILAFSPLGRPRTWRMLVILEALRMLAFESEPPAAGRTGALEDMLDALRRRASQGETSHFAALGVHFASHASEHKLALERIVAKYGPTSPVALASAETRKLGEEIVTRAKTAAAALSDLESRTAYRAEILSAMEIRAAVDLLLGQLKLARMRQLPELTEQLAEVILELDPRALGEAE